MHHLCYILLHRVRKKLGGKAVDAKEELLAGKERNNELSAMKTMVSSVRISLPALLTQHPH